MRHVSRFFEDYFHNRENLARRLLLSCNTRHCAYGKHDVCKLTPSDVQLPNLADDPSRKGEI